MGGEETRFFPGLLPFSLQAGQIIIHSISPGAISQTRNAKNKKIRE
jgi:hypothetical protein